MLNAITLAYHRWDIRRRIRKHGWTGTYVYGDEVPFSYTTGFREALDQPEIIAFGLDPEAGNGLFWTAFQQLKAGELTLRDLDEWHLDWEDGPRMVWRAVHCSQIRRKFFNVAIWRSDSLGLSREGLKAFQLVVSDASRIMPWEEGYDQDYRPIQQELWRPYMGPPDDD
jgi:hypothetical protein